MPPVSPRARRAALRSAVIAAVALAGCELYDPSLLEDAPETPDGAQEPMDAGGDAQPRDGQMPPPDGAGDDACVERAEICNGADDDCDGRVDEQTQAYCEQQLPNSRAVCGDIGRCLNLGCNAGFISCDGNPSNGCEPRCMCRPCPDAGDDDAGDGDAG